MIEVILDKSILDDFGIKSSFPSNLLDRIFASDKNLFILTKPLVEFIEKHANPFQLAKWSELFTNLSDNKKIAYDQNDTLDSEVIFNGGKRFHDYVLVLTSNTTNLFSCALNDSTSVNLCFLDLMKNDAKTIVSYTNFTNDNDINTFFDKLFNCSKRKTHRMVIISRYLDCHSPIITLVKKYFTQIEYWTTRKSYPDITNNLSDLKKQLGNSLFLYLGKSSDIHERQMILGNLVITADDDFDKINTQYKTWQINIAIDEIFANTVASKRSILQRVQY